MSAACTGYLRQVDLPSDGKSARLILCTGCTEATLVIGVSPVGTYDTRREAEDAYIARITEGAI